MLLSPNPSLKLPILARFLCLTRPTPTLLPRMPRNLSRSRFGTSIGCYLLTELHFPLLLPMSPSSFPSFSPPALP